MKNNAHVESFFHFMSAEELRGNTFAADEQLSNALSGHIAFYNQQCQRFALQRIWASVKKPLQIR